MDTWTASAGIPAGATVESDRVDPLTFYGFAAGTFYASADGGATFTARATGLPAKGNVRFKAVPGRKGDIWLSGGAPDAAYGLWHSTDGGATFTRVAGVEQADTVGFGKAAPGAAYPALYSSARIGGVRGVFRSTDAGASWVRINDDAHQWGWTGGAITGDPRVFGRVYVSTNGRGIVYGDTAEQGGTDPTPAACKVTYRITHQWQGGFQADITLTNTSGTAWTGWTVRWTQPAGQRVTQAWNATVTQSGAEVTATHLTYNATLPPGGSTGFGFNGSWTGTNPPPTAPTCVPGT